MGQKSETPLTAGPGLRDAPSGAAPVRAAVPPPRREACIGKSVVVKGQILSDEDLYVDGQIEGTVELPGNRLTVGLSGKVKASVKAREVDAIGTIHGDIVAVEKIIIRKEAHLVGDLKSASISIEDGAYFKGSIDIVRPVPAKPAAPTPPASLPLSPPPSPPSAGQGKTVSQSSKPAPLPGARKSQT